MIDLSEKKFNLKPRIKEEHILDNIDSYQIFKYYCPDIEYGKLIESPLRNDDTDPSFGLFFSKRHNKLMFKDFGGKSGDAIRFVKELLGLNYNETLATIAYDFGLDEYFHIGEYTFNCKYSDTNPKNLPKFDKKQIKASTVINIKSRKFNSTDILWWKQFGISLDTLKHFDIIPISYYFINDLVFRAEKLAYAFREEKDNRVTYKIYQPKSKDSKWFTNHDKTVHQGYTKLPETGEILFITKSLKDVASLYEVFNIPAIAIQSESVVISKKVIDEYKQRFETVYTNFDFDNPGIRLSNLYNDRYSLIPIFTLDKENKDISDFVKSHGIEKTKTFFKNIYQL